MSDLFIGLMSGTSLDGVDGVLVRLAPAATPSALTAPALAPSTAAPQVLAAVHAPYPAALRSAVLDLCAEQGGRFSVLGRVDVQIARVYADVVAQLLARAAVPASAVRGIGAHGQTVHHEPHGDTPFTLQLGDPNLLAASSGITVVADFRRRDMALGGQGAPLAPGFHEVAFRHPTRCRVVLNTGGIANISVLAPGQDCIGYDTGPANILMDAWVQSRHGLDFDDGGRLALQGQVHAPLLARLRADPYFALPPPKSTGREYFNLAWLEGHLAQLDADIPGADVQRTLLELTAGTVADAIARHAINLQHGGDLLVAGGGARNTALLQRLQALNPGWQVQTTAPFGVPPEQVEAVAFAVFAQRTLDGLPGNLPSVTGASRPCVLGGIYVP